MRRHSKRYRILRPGFGFCSIQDPRLTRVDGTGIIIMQHVANTKSTDRDGERLKEISVGKSISKKDHLVQLLSNPKGARVLSLCKTLGWKRHSVRAAVSGLRAGGVPDPIKWREALAGLSTEAMPLLRCFSTTLFSMEIIGRQVICYVFQSDRYTHAYVSLAYAPRTDVLTCETVDSGVESV